MYFNRRIFSLAVPAVAAIALLGLVEHPAHAQTVTFSKNVTPLSAPKNVNEGKHEDPNNAFAFQENQNVVLTKSLNVDVVSPGYTSSGIIAAGTDVDSFMFYTDPPGSPQPPTQFTGTLVFNAPILGLEILSKSLDGTDALLGLSATNYPNGGARGLESKDAFSIIDNGYGISWDTFSTSSDVDEVRVITATPEPTAALPMGLALLTGLVLWRRRPARAGQPA